MEEKVNEITFIKNKKINQSDLRKRSLNKYLLSSNVLDTGAGETTENNSLPSRGF